MGGLAITLPGEAVLFSIKTVVTRGGVTPPPTEGILAGFDGARPYAAKTPRPSPSAAVSSPYLAAAESKKRSVCTSRPASTPQPDGDLTPPLRAGSGAIRFNRAPL